MNPAFWILWLATGMPVPVIGQTATGNNLVQFPGQENPVAVPESWRGSRWDHIGGTE